MLTIRNGEIYDPCNGVNGETRDLYVRDGKIVAEPVQGRVIDATGMIVMPGGIEFHAHVAGSKVNLGRKMRPEDHRELVFPRTEVTRSGVGHTVPSTFATGYALARLGYTTLMEAAGPPLGARHVHEELNDIPIVDKAFFLLMGNNYFVLKFIAERDFERLKHFVAWLLESSGAYAIKIVNPAGVDTWKWGRNVESLDQPAATFPVTPREIVTSLARVQQELGLPHPIHVHCNNLGVPGNAAITLETMRAVGDLPIHITHIQFNGYGGTDWTDFRSGAEELAAYVNDHPNVTIDIGQVVFGPVTTMTADGPWQYRLHKLCGHKWANGDVENETSGGIVPYKFVRKNSVNAIQWAIGLEMALMVNDPWRVFLTTDHPNGGPFHAYPDIIKLLMDRNYRAEVMETVHKRVWTHSQLKDLDREYTLYEIAIITRAGPARSLGLEHKGHLGPGADADIAIYPKLDDPREMFRRPRYVIKDGEVVVEDGRVVQDRPGRTFYVAPGYDPQIVPAIREEFARLYTVSFENYPVQLEHYLPRRETVPCGSR
ncbi:MAG: formylmethanofuran dehydrogenase subunit A [Chloroflexia bacterium]